MAIPNSTFTTRMANCYDKSQTETMTLRPSTVSMRKQVELISKQQPRLPCSVKSTWPIKMDMCNRSQLPTDGILHRSQATTNISLTPGAIAILLLYIPYTITWDEPFGRCSTIKNSSQNWQSSICFANSSSSSQPRKAWN